MLIKILKGTVCDTVTVSPGDEIDASVASARYLIAKGKAVALDKPETEKPAVEEPEAAVKPKSVKKRATKSRKSKTLKGD